MMEIIVDLQLQLQELLEKVCIVDNLDILFQMTNLLKNVRTEILKMKRYLLCESECPLDTPLCSLEDTLTS